MPPCPLACHPCHGNGARGPRRSISGAPVHSPPLGGQALAAMGETDARGRRRPPRDARPGATRRGVRPPDRSRENPALDGTEAQVEPQPGGLYLVNVTGARTARGSFRGGKPVHRQHTASAGMTARSCAGVKPGRDRPDRAAGRNADAPHPHRPAQCRAMRQSCGRLGPLLRPAGRGCGRARPGPRPLAWPHG